MGERRVLWAMLKGNWLMFAPLMQQRYAPVWLPLSRDHPCKACVYVRETTNKTPTTYTDTVHNCMLFGISTQAARTRTVVIRMACRMPSDHERLTAHWCLLHAHIHANVVLYSQAATRAYAHMHRLQYALYAYSKWSVYIHIYHFSPILAGTTYTYIHRYYIYTLYIRSAWI